MSTVLRKFHDVEEKKNKVVKERAVVLISCPENPEVISAVVNCFVYNQAKIIEMGQHTTNYEDGMLFVRFEVELDSSEKHLVGFKEDLDALAVKYHMNWKLETKKERKRMAVFVSKMDQHVLELIYRTKNKEIQAEIVMVISNHPDLRESVEQHGIPFYYIPISKETKAEAEKQALQLIEGKVDFIVLARYMQIISPEFISHYENKIINIHHSFLPAFVGARPYDRAYERGVKFIGATAHYVTNDLDAGPIIQQDVQRVTHRHTAKDLKVIGSHIEKDVLAQAVSWHVEDRVIVHNNKTIIFS
ncbi:formyltetrahydrofolate deformylase [Bacillus timonensis]|uniref:formyltetrahydrofolate deformylase n=1 Tax=Bacillus timonensis TaxID=1033734 RepID=UPI000288C234|nr:formyltetrahydrofolate deformylase [Bacillus timonensis]